MRARARALLAVLLLASCSERGLPAGGRQHPLLSTPGSRISLPELPRAMAAAEPLLLQRGWGSGAGELGRRSEASRPGPMSLAVDGEGRLHLLDQVNRRLLRFDAAGAPLGALPLPSETAEDLVAAGDRVFVLYYEPGVDPGYRLVAHGPAGELQQQQRLDRSIQLCTGLFAVGEASSPDLYVERRHFDQVLVARRGQLLPEAAQTQVRLGRAARGGGPRLLVGREGANRAVVHRVEALRYTSRLLELELPSPLVAIDDWLVGEDGRFLLSLLLEAPAGAQRRVLMIQGGSVLGDWQVPAARDTEALRWLALGPGGQPVLMLSQSDGVRLHRLGGGR